MAWISDQAERFARRAAGELEALVAVSSPSGDVEGAERCFAICAALAPAQATLQRVPCSSPGHAPDLIISLAGTGSGRFVLVGHVDTVIAHSEHRPLTREGEHLVGSGTVDMKAGVLLALAMLRGLAERPADFAQAALLIVCDEEWRTTPFSHTERFADWDACLCFEAGTLTDAGEQAVVVRRKAAGTVRIDATGRAAHSGSAPERGRNALLALARAAELVAARNAPDGPERLTAVPTVLRAGEAFNVVPGSGELICDLRADTAAAIHAALAAVPAEIDGVGLESTLVRLWPGMDATAACAPLLARAGAAIGRPIVGLPRGGASDASHLATAIALTVDGLGPRGGAAHNPDEYVLVPSLAERALVALAIIDELLARP